MWLSLPCWGFVSFVSVFGIKSANKKREDIGRNEKQFWSKWWGYVRVLWESSFVLKQDHKWQRWSFGGLMKKVRDFSISFKFMWFFIVNSYWIYFDRIYLEHIIN